MDMEFIGGTMEKYIQELGKVIKCTEKVFWNGLRAKNMKGILIMIRDMG
jgi:hypothetical protein